MPAKGHKPDCGCPICKRVKAKMAPKPAKKPVAKAVKPAPKAEPVPVPKPEPVIKTTPKPEPASVPAKPVPKEPKFVEGQQVMVTRKLRYMGLNMPAGTKSLVHGFGGGKIKIEYRKVFFWVMPEDVKLV